MVCRPTAVALKQEGPWTYGGLVNHIVSVAGDDDRGDVNATFVQPFVNYTTPSGWAYGANMETTRDWENNEWAVPLNLFASKVTRLGGQLVQIGGGVRFHLDSTDGAPRGWDSVSTWYCCFRSDRGLAWHAAILSPMPPRRTVDMPGPGVP